MQFAFAGDVVKSHISNTITKLSNLTCIDFVPWKFEESFIEFQNGDTCS